ncbi:hypothetical protein ABW20_dc0103094 [Dactylellina cionopaga]|nr:hypothetical protein ABW20_dc0103094 [Dactylellina cionopaga]
MGELKQPSTDQQLKHIIPQPGVYPEQTLSDPPPQQQLQPPMHMPTGQAMQAPRSMLPSPFSASQTPAQQPHAPPEMQPPQLPSVLPGFGSNVSPHAPNPYGWPPSPISTPPTNYPNTYASPSLPAPLTSPPPANTAVTKGPYDSTLTTAPGGYSMMGSPMHYDQTHPTLQPLQSPLPHRPSIPSSIHLQPPHTSPGMSNFHHSPLPLLPPENSRYSSPASSGAAGYPSRTPPRPSDPWEPPLANFNHSDPMSLDVQDIPNEKLGFGEDARALRQLDKTFMRV